MDTVQHQLWRSCQVTPSTALMMVRCLRLLKKVLVLVGVGVFASLLLQELTGSLLPPIPGINEPIRIERRAPPFLSKSHRAVHPVQPLPAPESNKLGNLSIPGGKHLEAGVTLNASAEALNQTAQWPLANDTNEVLVVVTKGNVSVGANVSEVQAQVAAGGAVPALGGVGRVGVAPAGGGVGAAGSVAGALPNLNGSQVPKSALPGLGSYNASANTSMAELNHYVVYVTNTVTDNIYIKPASDLFKFKIKSCSDAYLLYKQKVSSSDKYSYHIGFGYGTKTVVWKKPPESMTKEFRTPKGGRIDCERTVSLWVQHVGNTFNVGFGQNEKPYMEWTDLDKPYETASMTLANPWPKKQAIWYLDMGSVDILRVDTGKDYSYEQLWLTVIGKNSVVVQVRACHDVYILLSDKYAAEGNVYEVALGIRDNELSAIREEKFGPNVAADETPGILDCNDFRAFWLQWSSGKLQVGKGTKLGQRKILEHTKVNHPRKIKSIALSTGQGAVGRWLFNLPQDQLFPL